MNLKVMQNNDLVQIVSKSKKILFSVFFHNVSLLTFSNITTAILGIVQTIIIARWLGPEQYGLIALVMNYPQLVYSILDVRTIEGTTKFLSEFRTSKCSQEAMAVCKVSYTIDICISIVAFVIILVTASWAAKSLFKQPSIAPLMTLYALALFPRGLYNTSYAILVTFNKFSFLAWTNLICRSIQLFSVLFLTYFWGVAGVVIGTILGVTMQSAFISCRAYQQVRREWGKFKQIRPFVVLRRRIKEIFQFYLFTSATLIVALPMQQLDVTLLGYFRTPSEVGLYKIAKTLAGSLIYFVDALQQVSYPRLVNKWIEDKIQFFRQLRQLVFLGLATGPIIFSAVIFVISILTFLIGQKFFGAIYPLIWLWAAFTLRLVFFWLRPFFLSIGKVSFWFKLQSVAIVIGMITMFISAALWGMNGVAFSVFIYYISIFLFGITFAYTFYLRSEHNVTPY
ncbi:MAG: oligosaccharide flippase family protein [Armatimonadetes bacterium]|nr:oligosaccharide flippase family protein [Armatimonadota bacterium]